MNLFRILKALFTPAPKLPASVCFDRVRSGGAVLIDVRQPAEWIEGVAERAVLLSLADLTGRRAEWRPFLAAHAGRELLVYCAAGGRSAIAARILTKEGFRAINAGSLRDWAGAGWPVVKPPGSAR